MYCKLNGRVSTLLLFLSKAYFFFLFGLRHHPCEFIQFLSITQLLTLIYIRFMLKFVENPGNSWKTQTPMPSSKIFRNYFKCLYSGSQAPMFYYASLKQNEWPPETLSQDTSVPRWLWQIDNLLCHLSLNWAKACVPFLAMWRDDPCAVDGILCCIPEAWLFLTAVTYHKYPLSPSYVPAGETGNIQENFGNSFTVSHYKWNVQFHKIEMGREGGKLWSSLNFVSEQGTWWKELLILARMKVLVLCGTLWQRFIPCCS